MNKEKASRLIDAAMGRSLCDLVIRNAEVVDVCNKNSFKADVYVKDGMIAGFDGDRKAKEEIDNTVFTGKSSFVTVEVKGTKEVQKVKIDADSIEKDEIEMLEDMILVAINEASKKVDRETENKMGKYTNGMPGLF